MYLPRNSAPTTARTSSPSRRSVRPKVWISTRKPVLRRRRE
jgi:hypothetical protein